MNRKQNLGKLPLSRRAHTTEDPRHVREGQARSLLRNLSNPSESRLQGVLLEVCYDSQPGFERDRDRNPKDHLIHHSAVKGTNRYPKMIPSLSLVFPSSSPTPPYSSG